jgi:hypothetical protein
MALDYSSYQATNPLSMAMQGFKDAGAIQAAKQQQAIGQQNFELNQMKVDEYKKAQDKQKQFQQVVSSLGPNPTADQVKGVLVDFPMFSESIKPRWDMLNEAQQKVSYSFYTQLLAAVEAGRPEAAIKIAQERADAAKASGNDEEAAALEAQILNIQSSPEGAKLGLIMSAGVVAPEKLPTLMAELANIRRANELQPMLKDEATAKAAEAAIKAKFAESLAAAEASSKGFDISSLITDPKIAKQNKRIANLINARDKATSELSLQKLESDLNDAQIARDNATIEKASEVETAQLNVDTMMSTVEDLEALGEQKITTMGIPFQNVREAATGTLEGSDAWYNATWNPPVADYQETIKTLQDQVFLTQIPKMRGMGALSQAEGVRLSGALKSLSLRQSSERLKNNIATIKELTNKAQKFLQNKYGDIGANTAEAKGRISAGGMGVQVPGEQTSGGQFRIINRRPGTE